MFFWLIIQKTTSPTHCKINVRANVYRLLKILEETMRKLLLLLLIVTGLSMPTPVQAFWGNSKVALVVGNSRYAFAPLKNPVNDARDISNKLEKLGFDVVCVTDAHQETLAQTISDFKTRLKKSNGVGLFYYAGHAVQVRDVNYLLPVDMALNDSVSLAQTAVRVDTIMNIMEGSGNDTNIVILDACRNNPFDGYVEDATKEGGLTRAVRGVKVERATGLADVQSFPKTFIAYATSPNKTAADGSGRNGIYTKHLLRHIETEGLDIETIFKRVRKGVISESRGRQIPWERSSLLEDFYFIKPKQEGGKRRLFGAF